MAPALAHPGQRGRYGRDATPIGMAHVPAALNKEKDTAREANPSRMAPAPARPGQRGRYGRDASPIGMAHAQATPNKEKGWPLPQPTPDKEEDTAGVPAR